MNTIFTTANGTQVFTHDEAHPHRMDLAAEAIAKMTIPAVPADPSDRSQTRVCQTVDMGREIGINHLVSVNNDDHLDKVLYVYRGDREWDTPMIYRPGEPETRLTSVCFWVAEENHWVLWTNFEGDDSGYPEPGCDRYNNGTVEFKEKCDDYWNEHAIVIDIPIYAARIKTVYGDTYEKLYTDKERAIKENRATATYLHKKYKITMRAWVQEYRQ